MQLKTEARSATDALSTFKARSEFQTMDALWRQLQEALKYKEDMSAKIEEVKRWSRDLSLSGKKCCKTLRQNFLNRLPDSGLLDGGASATTPVPSL